MLGPHSAARLPRPRKNCHCQGTSPSRVSPAGCNELHMWELSVPLRSGKSGKVGRTPGGPSQVMFKAGLSARPAQVTPVLAPVSSQRRSHPKAAQLSWEKLFPYGQLELSLLQLLHRVTCPFPEHPAGLWAFPRRQGNFRGISEELLENLCFSRLESPPHSALGLVSCATKGLP